MYEQCIGMPPVNAHALINLAIIYEDSGRWDEAARCLETVLADGTVGRDVTQEEVEAAAKDGLVAAYAIADKMERRDAISAVKAHDPGRSICNQSGG